MDDIAISIIVPVYNAGEGIKKCIDSVVSNSFENYELLLIDDCSSDNTLEIMKGYVRECNNSRIRVIESEENRRTGGARNRGIRNSKGRYVLYLDQDDSLTENALELMWNVSNNGEVDCIYGMIKDYGNRVCNRLAIKNNQKYDNDLMRQISSDFGYVFGILIRKNVIVENKLYFPEKVMFEDTLYASVMFSVVHSCNCVEDVVIERAGDEKSMTGSGIDNNKMIHRQNSALWYMKRIDSNNSCYDIILSHFIYYTFVSAIVFSRNRSNEKVLLRGRDMVLKYGFDINTFKSIYHSYYDESEINMFWRLYNSESEIKRYLVKKSLKTVPYDFVYWIYVKSGIRKIRRR